MNLLSLDSFIKRSDEFITATVDDDLVMMSVEKGMYYGLDSIGSQIWVHLVEPISVGALCQKLTDQYEVDSVQCQQDVLAFLNNLLSENMIHVVTKSTE